MQAALGRSTVKETMMIALKATMTAAVVTATLLAVPAFAGGPVEPVPEPVIAPVAVIEPVDMGGEWGGAYVGAQLGYADISSNGAGLDGNGAIGGVHGGYRYDFGKAVIGAELDYDLSNIDLETADSSLDNVARLKLMAGADLGRTLVYGTIGAAYAQATVAGDDLADDGYFAGIGADYAFNDRWTVGGEVLAHRFDDFDGSGVDLEATTATLRASFNF
jgi:outer membrane immunogenic protein